MIYCLAVNYLVGQARGTVIKWEDLGSPEMSLKVIMTTESLIEENIVRVRVSSLNLKFHFFLKMFMLMLIFLDGRAV